MHVEVSKRKMNLCLFVPEPFTEYNLRLNDKEEINTSKYLKPESYSPHNPDFTALSSQPNKISQNELSDFIRDLDLSKSKAEILMFKL